MKSVLLLCCLCSALSCARAADEPTTVAAAAQPATPCPSSAAVEGMTTTVQVPVEGMTCAACAGHIKDALGKVAGVKRTQVRLAERDVLVDVVRPTVTDECLVATIQSVGDYKAGAPQVVAR